MGAPRQTKLWGPGPLAPQYIMIFYGSDLVQFRSKSTFRNAGSIEVPLGTSAFCVVVVVVVILFFIFGQPI